MNRLFTSIVLALAIMSSATAQNAASANLGQNPDEVIILSSFVDGNYNVERLLVMESSPNNNEFVMRYKINLTKLISSYDNNSAEIAGLHNFIESIQKDSLKRITHYDVIGTASPDGPAALNAKLSNERAVDFCDFVDKECDMEGFPHTVTAIPYKWADTRQAIQESNISNKAQILSIVGSSNSQSAIQQELESHPAAWNYMKDYILPPMRSVEIHVKYNSWKVVENRTLIEEEVVPTEPTVKTVIVEERRESDCWVEDDYINCLLIEMPGQEIDFNCGKEREKLKIGKHSAKFKEVGRGFRDKEKARRW